MEHTCAGLENYNRSVVSGVNGWMLIHEHDEYENIDVTTEGIKHCPFCGVKLDES